jgi:hypothetical protein
MPFANTMWGEWSYRLVTFAGVLVASMNQINQDFPQIFGFVLLSGRRSVRASGRPWSGSNAMPGSCGDEFEQGWGMDASRGNIL